MSVQVIRRPLCGGVCDECGGKLFSDVKDAMEIGGEELDVLVEVLTAEAASDRPTAAEALQHDFFTDVPDPEPECDCILMAHCGGDSVPESQGIKCANGHFVCNADFNHYVRTKVDADNLRLFEVNQGHIYCPKRRSGGCDARAFTEAEIARHCVDGEAFAAYQKGRMQLYDTQMASEMEQRMKDRLAAEKRRWEEMSQHQRDVEEARQHITEKLLNLKCPRCNSVFHDFNGCCALTCGKPGCGCHFCAYCQADCGDDAHSHVSSRSCPGNTKAQNQGGYFPDAGYLDTVWRDARQKKVDAYLATLSSPKLRDDVLQACQRDFADIGLRVAQSPQGLQGGERLAELVGMGFEVDDARHALEAAGGDLTKAAAFLLEEA